MGDFFSPTAPGCALFCSLLYNVYQEEERIKSHVLTCDYQDLGVSSVTLLIVNILLSHTLTQSFSQSFSLSLSRARAPSALQVLFTSPSGQRSARTVRRAWTLSQTRRLSCSRRRHTLPLACQRVGGLLYPETLKLNPALKPLKPKP